MTPAEAHAAFLRGLRGSSRGWRPHDGPQRQFAESTADEVLYGGSVGGGKTFGALGLLIPYLTHPHLRVLFLRRETPHLRDAIDKAKQIFKHGMDAGPRPFAPAYPKVEFKSSPVHVAEFPSGARIYFDHCQNADDWEKYTGQEYQIVIFDELTHFLEHQYKEISARIRSAIPGLPRFRRAMSNPGSTGHAWVFKRWRFWLDPEAVIPGRDPRISPEGQVLPPAAPGEVLWIYHDPERGVDVVTHQADPRAASRTFIPARLSDNPTLLATDPNYEATKLADMDPVRRKQLTRGDWLVKPAAGLYFRREWMPIVEGVPSGRAVAVRRWDLAATEPHANNTDPDWTSGVRLVKHEDGLYYLTDIARTRQGPGGVVAFVDTTIKMDGREVWQRFAEDPGQAGKSQAADYVKLAIGHGVNAAASRETGAKELRIQRVSAAIAPPPGEKYGRFRIVAGPWLASFISQAEAWPDVDHDDDLDALAGAYDVLCDARVGAAPKPLIFPRRSASGGAGM